MQRVLSSVFMLLVALLVIGCNKRDNVIGSVAPSGLPVTDNSPKTVLVLGPNFKGDPGKFSVLLKGEKGPNDLINGLVLKPGDAVRTSQGESWSGVMLEGWDFANDPNGVKVTTAIPFDWELALRNPEKAYDHFQLNYVPGETYPSPKARTIELGLKILPGGHQPGHVIEIMIDLEHMIIQTPAKPALAAKCRVKNNRLTCPEMPF